MDTITMFIAALVIVVFAIVVSRAELVEVRIIGLIVLAGGVFAVAHGYQGNMRGFLVNVSTELIGTAITVIILGSWVLLSRWSFYVILTIVLASVLFIEVAGDDSDFVLNLSTELLGAFTIFTLINREWLWMNKRERWKQDRDNTRSRRPPHR